MTMRIDRIEARDPAAREAVLKVLETYNAGASGQPQPAGWLNLVIREPGSDTIAGGLCAVSYWDWMFVELLVVPPALRGQGLGTSLIRQAEAVALERGCSGIWLDTFSFQAPGFYEKLGFHRFGTIEHYPAGHSRFFYRKQLAPPG